MKQQALKSTLILLTVISVVCDTMILPFYPQFFATEFNVSSSLHVGSYLATCCITVMCAFPLWAKVARRVHELHLWVVTQIIAGGLGVACYFATDLLAFWLLSQTMLVFKASYLLIYPFVLSLEEKEKHLGIVGLFSVLMHFGGIGGALLGGLVLHSFDPRALYLIMAAGDAVQVLLCLYLIRVLAVTWHQRALGESTTERARIPRFVLVLGLVSMGVYFSAFLARPFFTLFWQQLSGFNNDILAGFVFAIPAWVALACLYRNHRRPRSQAHHGKDIAWAMLLASIGLLLHGAQAWPVMIFGRVLLGIGLFVVTVRLEVVLFALSEPRFYGSDFAKVHFMQNIGLISASFLVGSLVSDGNYTLPFFVASAAFMLTLMVFYGLYMRPEAQQFNRVSQTSTPSQ
ncbi:MFS transporter [Pseudoalteromonas ruthenica]|uniref:MFS transporter n=1 Tax=Pseudoalteromonas ruthenica TaxID=151081 RepID=UPI00034C3DB5|nr:MFS transporter [Pseudoalteromonas ruthenica]